MNRVKRLRPVRRQSVTCENCGDLPSTMLAQDLARLHEWFTSHRTKLVSHDLPIHRRGFDAAKGEK